MVNKNFGNLCLLLLGFFTVLPGITNLYCQPVSFEFEYLTPNEGLSQASVIQIIKDDQGFMWFGTRNGLNRYDGYNFTKYHSNPADTSTLPGDIMLSLFLDSNSDLWIGTDNGFCIYNRDMDNFTNFRQRSSYPVELTYANISYIFEDSFHEYWLGTYGAGLVRFNKKAESYRIYSNIAGNVKSISNNNIRGILENKDGDLWIATDGGGLNLFRRENETFSHFIPEEGDPNSISNLSVFSVVKDNEGVIWLGTMGNGICRLNELHDGTFTFDRFSPKTDDVNRLKVLTMCADPKGDLWIGTENGGLDHYDISKNSFYNYRYDDMKLFTLNSNSIQSMYIDDIGNFWIGTYTGGVNVNKKNKKSFITFSRIPGNKNSLSYNAVTCFFQDSNNNIWIGTDGGGLNIYNRDTKEFSIYNSENSALLSNVVLTICSDKDGNIWVGGWGCGLNRYDKLNKKFINYKPDKYRLPHNNIFDIEPDKTGNIWISFAGNGMVRFDTRTNRHKNYLENNSDLPNNWIFDIAIDHEENVLIGHAVGLSILIPESGEFMNYSRMEDTNSLSNNLINVIEVATDSTYWIGTSAGLNHFYPKTKRFESYFIHDGLPDNSIAGIIEDLDQNIWISTNNGLSKYNPKMNLFTNYSYSDGLQGNDFIRNSCLILESGELLFGGTNGFNIFYPDSLKQNTVVPEVVITNFSIFNKPVKIGTKGSPLVKHINECEEITLSYKHSVFSFEFAALEYTSPNQNRYAYKLEPFDKEWNEVGTNRTATYTNLNPGKYNLIVKASNNDNKWVPEEKYKQLAIIIKPPFWRMAWFISLILTFTIGSVILFLRFRFLRLKNLNLMLEKRVDKRTIELKERTYELEETTALLEEKQEEILSQKEELMTQRDILEDKNALLVKQQDQIVEQNTELDKHRNELELLVEKRTHELADALKRAEESDQLKSAFLANMSHEIRTPMNAIIGFVSLLKEENLTNNDRRHYIEIINKNSESLLVLINDIIDISTIQANQMQINVEPININKLLNHAYDNFRLIAKRKIIELKLNITALSEGFTISGDEIRLTQVLNNLISNAIKFTTHGYVEFGISSINNDVTFYVKDTGIGIPAGNEKAIFERFKKIAENEEVLYSGTGLGLSISKSLVELWGGKIWFESMENTGTTFYFTHPVSEQKKVLENSAIAAENIEMPDLKDKTIIIAEDESDSYNLLNTYLSETHARIFWAKSGKQVLELVTDNHIDLVLMDIKMPELDGKMITRKVRAIKPVLPIIAQTAYASEKDIKEILDSGINDYLIKPIEKAKLASLINKYL